MNTSNRLIIVTESQAHWRVIINNPPFNLFDPTMFAERNVLMDNIEKDEHLKVVVCESGAPDFFMNHHNVDNQLAVPEQPRSMPFFGNWPKWVTRLA